MEMGSDMLYFHGNVSESSEHKIYMSIFYSQLFMSGDYVRLYHRIIIPVGQRGQILAIST